MDKDSNILNKKTLGVLLAISSIGLFLLIISMIVDAPDDSGKILSWMLINHGVITTLLIVVTSFSMAMLIAYLILKRKYKE